MPDSRSNSGADLRRHEAGGVRRALNEGHIRHIKSNFEYADKLLTEIEGILTAASSKSVFPRYVPDITPAQAKVIEDYIARFRAQLIRVLVSFGITPQQPKTGSTHAIRVTLSFIRIAIEESAPRHLRGYGTVPEELIPELNGLSDELEGLITKLDAFLAEGPGRDLKSRLARLSQVGDEIETLKRLEEIVSRHGLVEFHTGVASIIDRLTNVRLEIAVFGQVSSGKSSLLNHILGRDILPVGVNPITAVPTRIVHGQQERVSVTFVTRKTEHHAITELRQFVSEQHNPANVKGVARIVVEIPAATLARGIVFVDTPGLGSLATAGAAETRAYLPQCDVGVLLINAGSTLGPEDVATIQSLYSAGIQPAVLMSKADLLKPADREQALAYIAAKLESELGVELPVYPVSVMAGHEELLDRWFREHVVPLFGERETLARDSIRRKIGVLRESVQAALRSKLEPVATGATAEEIEAADRRLRAAAGELSRVESLCFNKTDAIRNLGGIATRWAAMRLFKAWKSEQPFGVAEMVRSAMTEAAAADASEVSSVLNDAATALAEALGDTARVLGEPDDSARLELERAVREMPHMETSGVNFEMERPAAMLLGRTIATHVIEQRIEKTAGKEIEQACVSYSRVLRTWAHDTIALLASIFDARADRYRAQMERLLGHARAEPQTTANIEEDLRDLEESPAGDMEEERT